MKILTELEKVCVGFDRCILDLTKRDRYYLPITNCLHLKFDLSLQVGCCGSIGSEDYINARKPVPYECRDRVGGNEYRYGCAQQVWSLTQFYLVGIIYST